MKQNKLIYGIVIALIMFSSCSSDDNNNNTEDTISPIVGIWELIKEVNVCSSGSKNIIEVESCRQQSQMTFSSDGTFTIIEFDIDENEECVEDTNLKGTWTLTGEDLVMTVDGIKLPVTFFELSNNTLHFGEYFIKGQSDSYYFCEEGASPSHFYKEYSRVTE